MIGSATSALVFIIETICELYLLVLILRIVLPWLRADFRNPLAQAILKLTSPLVVPMRRILPPIGRLDTATVVVAFTIQYATILVIAWIARWPLNVLPIAITSIVNLAVLTIYLFVFSILIRVILSWFAAGVYNPATAIIDTLTEPVLRPFRRIVPPIGGIDLSPLFAMILLSAAAIFVSGAKMLPI